MSKFQSNSYGQILNSSSVMGFVSVLTQLLGMIRTKFAAVLIGATGLGILANFTAIQGLIGAFVGLGIQSSAVREVASAYANGDDQAIGKTVLTLRRLSLLTGLLGAIITLILSPLISQITFASYKHQWDIAAVGLIILFINLSNGELALLQGSRKIIEIAKIQVISAIVCTLGAIGLYYLLKLNGIILSLFLTATAQFAIAWHFSHRIPVPKINNMTWKQTFQMADAMVRQGLLMMMTGLIIAASAYITNVLITNQINLEAAGFYSAGLSLSGVFINFVLQGIGVDYYPRLSEVANDHVKINKLINEQTEIGLLLALPGALAIMIFSPWIVQLFFTKEFTPVVDLIQWFTLGCLGRVVSWPMTYALIAMQRTKTYFRLELFWNLLHLGLIYIGMTLFRIKGVAIAFSLLYLVITIQCLVTLRRISVFQWSTLTKKIIVVVILFTFTVFVLRNLSPSLPILVLMITILTMACLFSLRGVGRLLDQDHFLVRIIDTFPGGKFFLKKV